MRQWRRMICIAGVATMASASVSLAAQGPPPPRSASGARVDVVATGIPTPTAIAFGRGNVFVGAFGSEDGKSSGGVYVLRGGGAVRVPGLPGVGGLAWKGGTLYGTAGFRPGETPRIVAWSGWDGSRFARNRVVWSGPKGFRGLTGLAVGGNGRIYAGVGLSDDAGDHKKSARPFAQSVISMRLDGSDVRTVAKGLRQPWQLVFAQGVPRPFVTVLGQENLGKKQPPDYVIVARDGEDYGFPTCNWSKPKACASSAKPFALLPAHSSPTGIATTGSTLYVALFSGTGRGPEVVALPVRGGSPKRFLTRFAAPVVAVGASGNVVYAGDLTGTIYRVGR